MVWTLYVSKKSIPLQIVDPIEETVLDINSPVSDRTNGNTQLSGQCLLRGEMQKPLAGLLSHFLRYVHGVDSVCVQKIHTTSVSRSRETLRQAHAVGRITECLSSVDTAAVTVEHRSRSQASA